MYVELPFLFGAAFTLPGALTALTPIFLSMLSFTAGPHSDIATVLMSVEVSSPGPKSELSEIT